MSGGKTTTTSDSKNTATTTVDPRQLAMLEANYETAKANAAKLKPYSGQMTAGFDPAQLEAQGVLADIARGGQDTQASLGAARNAVGGILGFDPANMTASAITPQQIAGAGPVTAAQINGATVNRQGAVQAPNVNGAMVGTQAPVSVGEMNGATINRQTPVRASQVTGSLITPQAALNAPTIEAATAARQDPVTAERISAGLLADADLSPYMNKFQGDVVDATMAQQERARQIAQQGNARKASAASAFGGSRSAILDAQTNEAYDRNNAGILADLNFQNFRTAQDAATADINRRFSGDQFNASNRLSADSLNANLGQATELANQAALNSARSQNASNEINVGQFNNSLGQAAALANQNSENDASRFNASNTLSADTLNANLGQAAELANQSSANDASRFNIGNRLSADTLNANLGQQAALANQSSANDAERFNASNAIEAGQFNATLGQQAELANQASANDASRFNASNSLTADTLNANLGQQTRLANQAADLEGQRFNATAGMDAQRANIENDLAAVGLTLNAAGQLIPLNSAAFADEVGRAGLLGSVGDVRQGQEQAYLDALREEYLRSQTFPIQEQQLLNSSLGLIPMQQTVSGTSSGTNVEKKSGDLFGGILSTVLGGAKLASGMGFFGGS